MKPDKYVDFDNPTHLNKLVDELRVEIDELTDQLVSAHREGWEQGKREAVEVAKQTDFPPSPKSYYTLGRVDAANAIAAMEYKERTND